MSMHKGIDGDGVAIRRIKLSAHDTRRVSVTAPADPRTVRRLLRGEPVSPMARIRIERALRELGIDVPSDGRLTNASYLWDE